MSDERVLYVEVWAKAPNGQTYRPWRWTDGGPTHGGAFPNAEEAVAHFERVFKTPGWLYQLYEIVARPIERTMQHSERSIGGEK